jgi:hypothetical protein
MSRLNGDFDFATSSREAGDVVIADELMRSASNLDVDDEWRGITLHFAAQLLGAGNEKELARLMELGNGYTRDVVRRRWKSLKTPEAMSMLRVDDAAYRKFVQDFKQSLEAAGLQTETFSTQEFRIQPGRINPNFALLYMECRRPGAMAEWVRRFKDRSEGK